MSGKENTEYFIQ